MYNSSKNNRIKELVNPVTCGEIAWSPLILHWKSGPSLGIEKFAVLLNRLKSKLYSSDNHFSIVLVSTLTKKSLEKPKLTWLHLLLSWQAIYKRCMNLYFDIKGLIDDRLQIDSSRINRTNSIMIMSFVLHWNCHEHTYAFYLQEIKETEQRNRKF